MPQGNLDANGRVVLDGVVLHAPGLRGAVTVERAQPGRTLRGTDNVAPELEAALGRLEMQSDRTIVIRQPRTVPARSLDAVTRGERERRGMRAQDIDLEVPAPPPGRIQVALSVEEHGVATWHNHAPVVAAAAVRGERPTVRYTIARADAPPPAAAETVTRGLVPGLSHVIRIITFPLVKAAGGVARSWVRNWDQGKRPYLLRRYKLDGSLAELSAKDWDELAAGPVLLFVHGTFSTTEGAFTALPQDTRATLHARYGQRVIAFDHPTMADDPATNARWFLDQVLDRDLTLDIVCHSRGGLVSRCLAERPGSLAGIAPKVHVRKVVLVGVPSAGTILASADNWNKLLDVVTTALNLAGVAVGATLDAILALVRSLAVEVVKDLEGLDAMAPGSEFLGRLNDPSNARSDTAYAAIDSNYTPRNEGVRAWLRDAAIDALMDNKPNDIMVTIDSIRAANGSPNFPVARHADFVPADGVEHADYFGQARTTKAMLAWLK